MFSQNTNYIRTWNLNSFESLENELPDGLKVLLEAGVVLALLQRLHLKLADGRLHAIDMLPKDGVLLVELSGLFSQLPQLVLTRL